MTYLNKAVLLQQTGIGTSEVAARLCYDSFHKSESEAIKDFPIVVEYNESDPFSVSMKNIHNIEDSKVLDQLTWVHNHSSIMEHSVLTYYIRTTRGVLQELSRHRIASPSVRSTRYTMHGIICAYYTSLIDGKVDPLEYFADKLKALSVFGVEMEDETFRIYSDSIYKLLEIYIRRENVLSKKAINYLEHLDISVTREQAFDKMIVLDKKRNGGDSIKMIVSDIWSTELVWTINLRSLKNFIKLRDSGAAWGPMQNLAKQIVDATPPRYLALVKKKYRKK